MILSGESKIAIEAKFTEYTPKGEGTAKPISQWKNEGSSKENRELVLQYWTQLIQPFSKGIDLDLVSDVEYQFYHRTASACKDAGKAFVVYQVFYDEQTVAYLSSYKEKLEAYVKIINPNEQLNFYLWEIETFQKIHERADENPFVEMKNKNVYEFGKTNLHKLH